MSIVCLNLCVFKLEYFFIQVSESYTCYSSNKLITLLSLALKRLTPVKCLFFMCSVVIIFLLMSHVDLNRVSQVDKTCLLNGI